MRFAILLFMWSVVVIFPLLAQDVKQRDEQAYSALLLPAKVLLVSVLIYTGCVIGQLIAKVVR